ncbi:late competence development ComFB family protein [Acetivibrio mesophilus]|uniref:Competence protein ComFB n=1 Tax=Acetivibrio mesophilus TaxID=2487273 RepID=A0A4Q0I5V4_9FIRM|nr:late competence development ComFB family protein [Acetivibrio mesophilus]ODM25290.1 competence protein ComF [Clostridium sp. Bc-iso-3]RXE59690.1 competence protein ComFB [Acetivibrio mesophilus]HHV28589.1 late competence development ComFB family protein [Clostridium sp.]
MTQIKNYMEEIVFSLMKEVLADINVCSCEKCKMDIAAIALNDLPPKYIVSDKGELYSKVNSLKQQFEVDVISAVTKAAVMVKRNPRHD